MESTGVVERMGWLAPGIGLPSVRLAGTPGETTEITNSKMDVTAIDAAELGGGLCKLRHLY